MMAVIHRDLVPYLRTVIFHHVSLYWQL
jgi:hypothetical protein